MLILLRIDVNAIPTREYRRFARVGEGAGKGFASTGFVTVGRLAVSFWKFAIAGESFQLAPLLTISADCPRLPLGESLFTAALPVNG